MAIKVLENVADNVEEIEEEFLVLRDLSLHPNIPLFHGLFLKRGASQEEDQLWFVMEVRLFVCFVRQNFFVFMLKLIYTVRHI